MLSDIFLNRAAQVLGSNIAVMAGFYVLIAGAAWLSGYVLFRRSWKHRKIIADYPERSDMAREIFYSGISVIIFALFVVLTWWMKLHGWTRIYVTMNEYGWWWFFLSLPVTIVVHDAYFYWTHRLLHSRALYRWFHHTHHRSHNPSPWTSYAFAPLEAAVQAGIMPLVAVLYPVHPVPWALFMMFQFGINVTIHSGYEFMPRRFADSWISRVLSTPTSHIVHHQYSRGNYGFFFSFWDRLMGSHHPRYEERLRSVTSGS